MRVSIDDTSTVQRQNNGAWANFGESRFLIASNGSDKFQKALARLQAPYRDRIRRGTLDPTTAKSILCQAMSEAMILGWENVQRSDGTDVPFSPDVCRTMLLNNDDVREFVQEFSSDLANFKAEQVETSVKQ